MNKMLNLMMAVALSTAAGSAMASTIFPASGTISVSPGSDQAILGGTQAFHTYTDSWQVTASGASSVDTVFTGNWSTTTPGANFIQTFNLYSDASMNNLLATGVYSLFQGLMQFHFGYVLDKGTTYYLGVTGTGAYAGDVSGVSAVPLPAAGLLFGTALLGAAGLGRKKRETVQADAVAA